MRIAEVDSFLIDRAPVTNAEFAHFVRETGYVTLAEQMPDPRDFPGMPPELARPGSLTFEPPTAPGLHNKRASPTTWWRYTAGVSWRRPLGPGSSLEGIADHPVVHVALADALAFAAWADKSLPTEAEWERAARGGLEHADFAWGDSLEPEGRPMANYWQGPFPLRADDGQGWYGTSPVGSYPANGYGLHDMIGNVWEWTADSWSIAGQPGPAACCERMPEDGAAAMVLKGGSHLCADNYCARYRPAARIPQTPDTASGHIGFRCVVRL